MSTVASSRLHDVATKFHRISGGNEQLELRRHTRPFVFVKGRQCCETRGVCVSLDTVVYC